MKKFFYLAAFTVILSLTACRVTKTLTMLYAKERATMKESEFMVGKHAAVDFLKFSEAQNNAVEQVWKTEKKGFSEDKLENDKIAPVIYKSELDFRKILTTEQLEAYKALGNKNDARMAHYFLNDDQLAEIKRIYKL